MKAKVKVKAAAATLPPTKDDELSRQLKYQQHQIDALVGQVKVSVVKAMQPSLRVARTGAPSYGRGAYGTNTSSTGGRLLEEGPALSIRSHSPVQK